MNVSNKSARLRAGQGEDSFIGLVGDIGGTNARFAIAYRRGYEARLEHNQTIDCAGFSDLYQAVEVYFSGLPERPHLDFVALAMAGPVKNGAITLTNLPWTVTEAELRSKTGAKVARLMNDYAGLAFSLPHLTSEDTRLIGPLQKGTGEVYAVMGAGTGFGAAVLVGGAFGPYCLSTESGHATYAPVDDFGTSIHAYLRKRFGRVSVESLLSGPGLLNLYQAVCHIHDQKALDLTPAQITSLNGSDDFWCKRTLEAFIDILADVTGDIALYHGATAGVFVAGGITPRLIDHINPERFRSRMEAKAPMRAMVAAIPSKVIIHPHAAMIGAAHALSTAEIPHD
jgi:glucokinase